MSGLSYLRFIKTAKGQGYEIVLFFIWLENFNLAQSRVEARVKKGGHNILKNIIERRYYKGIHNFSQYALDVNDWYIFDNSHTEYKLIARSVEKTMEIFNFEVFNKFSLNEL